MSNPSWGFHKRWRRSFMIMYPTFLPKSLITEVSFQCSHKSWNTFCQGWFWVGDGSPLPSPLSSISGQSNRFYPLAEEFVSPIISSLNDSLSGSSSLVLKEKPWCGSGGLSGCKGGSRHEASNTMPSMRTNEKQQRSAAILVRFFLTSWIWNCYYLHLIYENILFFILYFNYNEYSISLFSYITISSFKYKLN